MIKTENIIIRGKTFVKTYSDLGVKVHGGFPEGDYDEAIDPIELGRTYTETNTPIDVDNTAKEILDILTGDAE